MRTIKTQQATINHIWKRQQSEACSIRKNLPNNFIYKKDEAGSYDLKCVKQQGAPKQLNNQENLKILSSLLLNDQQVTKSANKLSKKTVVIKLQLNKENNPIVNQLLSLEQSTKKTKQVSENRVCANHGHKMAKYAIDSQQLCGRCVIDYAIREGLPIRTLAAKSLIGEDDSRRKDQQKLVSVSLVSKDATFKQVSCQSFILKLNDLVDQSQCLITSIQVKQSDGYPIIQSMLESIMRDIQDNSVNIQQLQQDANTLVIRESLQGCIRDVESIKRDIVENIQNIVEGMEMAPFKVIIGKYKEKLEVFQNLLEEYKKKAIQLQNDQAQFLQNITSKEFELDLHNFICTSLKRFVHSASLFEFQGAVAQSKQQQHNNIIDSSKNGIVYFEGQSLKYEELLKKVNKHQASNSLFYHSLLKSFDMNKNPRYKTEDSQSQRMRE